MQAFLLLLSTLSQAAEPPPPPCGGLSCPTRVEEIARGFDEASGITAEELPLLASGECHHLSENFHAETPHHGVAFLDQKDGQIYLGGAFAFFYSENPYKDWTLTQARELPSLFESSHIVELTPSFAFSDMNPGKTPIWWYWLRRTGEKVFLMGHWGVNHRVLCELTVHPAASLLRSSPK